MESKLHAYTRVNNAVHRMLEQSDLVRGSCTEHNLSILEQKWNSVYSKVQDRKVIEFNVTCYANGIDFQSISS